MDGFHSNWLRILARTHDVVASAAKQSIRFGEEWVASSLRSSQRRKRLRLLAKACPIISCGLLVLVFTGCATTEAPEPSARIEIQQDVGFTITEQARISSDVRTDYNQALALLADERYDEGVALLEAIVEAAPQLSAPRIDLGIALHHAGKLEAAEESLSRAIELHPDHPVALNELGIVYRKTGRFAEARQSYEAALAVYPGYHYARRNLAILCDLYLADLDCALANYEAYMTTVHADDQAAVWIADIRQRLGR